MKCLLFWSLVASSLDILPAKHIQYMKWTIYHCDCCLYLGTLLAMEKVLFCYDNQAIVDIWRKNSTRVPQTIALVHLLYFCAAYHNALTFVHLPGVCNNIADFLSFPGEQFQETSPASKHHIRQHPCLAIAALHACLLECHYHGIAASTRRTYILYTFCTYHLFLHPFSLWNIFVLMIYCAVIHLMHVEHGFPDRTNNSLLVLVCWGISQQRNYQEPCLLHVWLLLFVLLLLHVQFLHN